MYVRFSLSLRNVEDLLHARCIDISHVTVRFWCNRFGLLFAAEFLTKRVSHMRAYSNWKWHLDEVFVNINGETHYLLRAVDHEGEVLESFVTKRRDRKAAFKFFRKTMKRHGRADVFVAVHASVHNHFNAERHLYDRSNFKLNRAAALTKWRGLCAA
jgi:putative transposase